MPGSTGILMKIEDDRILETRKKVRIRTRVENRTQKKLGVITVALIMLGASAIGIMIGIVLVNMMSGATKTDQLQNQPPDNFSSTPVSSPVASPVSSPGSKD